MSDVPEGSPDEQLRLLVERFNSLSGQLVHCIEQEARQQVLMEILRKDHTTPPELMFDAAQDHRKAEERTTTTVRLMVELRVKMERLADG